MSLREGKMTKQEEDRYEREISRLNKLVESYKKSIEYLSKRNK